MKGGEVFQFLHSRVLPMIEKALGELPSIEHIYVHQGSKLVVDAILKKFAREGVDIPSNIVERGNTVSATIPILISDSSGEESFCNSGPSLLVGFGVGLQAHLLVIDINHE